MSLFRTLLGLITLALVIPVAALYTQSGLSPWSEAQASPPSSGTESPLDQAKQHPRGQDGLAEKGDKTPKNSPPDHAKANGHTHTTTIGAPSESTSSTTFSSSTTTSTARTTSTSTSPVTPISTALTTTTSPSNDPGSVDDVITGDVCPCKVMGTVELKGQISLKGDLMVMGGTLIARPGVDLNGNGFQIMFMDGGRADFQGTPVFTWSDHGRKQNLVRDINFRNLRRIMFHSGADPSVLKYFTVSDSGTSALGDYPLHWHLNGNSTRGTIVEGVVVVNGANHAFVPHGSHGISIRDSIARSIRGQAFWWDPPGTNGCDDRTRRSCTVDNSNDILWEGNLVDNSYCPEFLTSCRSNSAFVMNAGSGNRAINNMAINTEGGVACAGYHWNELSNYNQGGTVWKFVGNKAFDDDCAGIDTWQNDGSVHVVENFESDGRISHGAYLNLYEYVNVTVPAFHIHALGWTLRDSSVGNVTVFRHGVNAPDFPVTIENTVMESFTIRNAHNGGVNAGTYILNSTNLNCGDIVYEAVVPGTKVIIDGQQC